MSNSNSSKPSGAKSLLVFLMIPIAIIIGLLIWWYVLGNPSNFVEGNRELNPNPDSILGLMFKGGALVGVLIGLFIIVITISIERFITIGRAKGSGSMEGFVQTIRKLVGNNDIEGAKAACARQRGSIAN